MSAAPADSRSQPAWQTEPLLPSQLSSRTLHMDVPELQLVAAILEDAIHCVARHAHTCDRRHGRAYDDARDWLLDDGRDHCFAFHNVCEFLSLDSGAVRTWVLRLLDRHPRPSSGGTPRGIHRERPAEHSKAPARRAPRREDSPMERFERLGWDEV